MNQPEKQQEKKSIKIFVNGHEELVSKDELSYDEIVAMAFPNPDFANNTYKVTYFLKNEKHEASLTKGQTVKPKEEMSFTVIRAIRS